jgi:MIP family channel proteins
MATKNSKLPNRAFAELFGTLIFVLIAAGSVVSATSLQLPSYIALPFVAVATGLALALAVSATMGISGGHLNPAVTIGLLAAGKIKFDEAVVYVIAQLIGATVGALLLFAFFPAALGSSVSWGVPALGAGVGVPQAIAVEAIMTFILVFMVFGTAVYELAPKIGGFGIGLAVTLDALIGGPITGAAMNVARWFGPALISLNFANWYVYILGPVIGGILAALVFMKLLVGKR